jgi:O-antigen ligase
MTQSFEKYLTELLRALLVVFPATLPFSRKISAAISIAIFILTLTLFGYKKIILSYKNRYVVLFMLPFIVSLVGLSYSECKDLLPLEKKASIVAFPIVFYLFKTDHNIVKFALASFVFGVTVLSLYSLGYTIRNDLPFDTEMTMQAVGISHVYASLFLVFSLVSIAYLFFRQTLLLKQAILIAIFLIQLVFLLFLGGKMAIFSLIFLSLVALTHFLKSGLITRKGRIAILIVPVFLFILSIYKIDHIKSRFSYLFNKEHYFVGDNAWSSIGVRLTIMVCSNEVIKNNKFFGTGTGDVQKDLNRCYEDKGYSTVKNMNAHNQYLEILLGSGIIGLLAILSVQYVFCRVALLERNYLFFSLIFILAFCFLTESILERQQGVMFYSFFSALLFFHKPPVT